MSAKGQGRRKSGCGGKPRRRWLPSVWGGLAVAGLPLGGREALPSVASIFGGGGGLAVDDLHLSCRQCPPSLGVAWPSVASICGGEALPLMTSIFMVGC